MPTSVSRIVKVNDGSVGYVEHAPLFRCDAASTISELSCRNFFVICVLRLARCAMQC